MSGPYWYSQRSRVSTLLTCCIICLHSVDAAISTRGVRHGRPERRLQGYNFDDVEVLNDDDSSLKNIDMNNNSAGSISGSSGAASKGGYSPLGGDNPSGYTGASYGASFSSTSYKWGGTTKTSTVNRTSSPSQVSLPLPVVLWVVLLALTLSLSATIFTAQQFQHNPRGDYANFCRAFLSAGHRISSIAYNLYKCRLGEVVDLIFRNTEEQDYTDDELERMKVRPGLARVLEVEHQKAMRKMELPNLSTING